MAKFIEMRVCGYCHTEFEAHHPSTKYCCNNHRAQAHQLRQRALRDQKRLSKAGRERLRFVQKWCPVAAAKIETDFFGKVGIGCVEEILEFAVYAMAEAQAKVIADKFPA